MTREQREKLKKENEVQFKMEGGEAIGRCPGCRGSNETLFGKGTGRAIEHLAGCRAALIVLLVDEVESWEWPRGWAMWMRGQRLTLEECDYSDEKKEGYRLALDHVEQTIKARMEPDT
jgi:hypothetical protein